MTVTKLALQTEVQLKSNWTERIRVDAEIIRSFTIPTFMLSFASGIMPKYIRRNKQCLIPHNQHALHDTVTTSAPVRNRLQSCHMFAEKAKQLTGDAQGKTNRTWVEGTWKIRWHTTHCILAEIIHSPSSTDKCHDLTRHWIVRLDRVRTFYGRFKYNMNLMGLSPSASCTLLASVLYTVTAGTWLHWTRPNATASRYACAI